MDSVSNLRDTLEAQLKEQTADSGMGLRADEMAVKYRELQTKYRGLIEEIKQGKNGVVNELINTEDDYQSSTEQNMKLKRKRHETNNEVNALQDQLKNLGELRNNLNVIQKDYLSIIKRINAEAGGETEGLSSEISGIDQDNGALDGQLKSESEYLNELKSMPKPENQSDEALASHVEHLIQTHNQRMTQHSNIESATLALNDAPERLFEVKPYSLTHDEHQAEVDEVLDEIKNRNGEINMII